MEFNLEVLKHQQEFIESRELHTALCGGYGSGKSEGGVYKTIIKKLEYPGISVAYYLPTYPLIEDVAFPKFEDALNKFGIKYNLNKQFKYFNTAFGKIILRSMDNPSRIIGYEVGYSLIDEADILGIDKMKDVYSKIIARNRTKLPNGDKNITDVVGTPEGFRWMYDYFVKNDKEGRRLIKAKTKDNPFLPDSYIETLEETYSKEQLAAYLDGEFVNLTTGTVYYKFDRNINNSIRTIKKHDTLYIGMDFNIGNMSAVVHIIDDVPIAVDEITKVYDTESMCNTIKEKYPSNRIIIYPDASGRNRSTNTTQTDIGILNESGFKVNAKSKNPLVLDRIKNMNRLFFNGSNIIGYKVNCLKCQEYTEALERMPYDKNGQPDKSSGFDHITDAGGYFLSYEYPLKKTKAAIYW